MGLWVFVDAVPDTKRYLSLTARFHVCSNVFHIFRSLLWGSYHILLFPILIVFNCAVIMADRRNSWADVVPQEDDNASILSLRELEPSPVDEWSPDSES